MSTQIGTPFSDNLLGGSRNDNLLGRKGDDNLFGDKGNDNLYGDEGNDNLFGGNGNDNLFGGNGNDNLFGGSGNDNLFGEKGDDIIFGNAGNDIISGGDGIDTLDYTGLGQVITLFADRTEKGGGLGSDRPSEPPSTEIIIADPGFINVIDISGTDLASLIDLGTEKFDIFDVPEAITIKNFVNVIGSNQNDTIIGNELNNVINGFGGRDTLSGGAAQDTFVLGENGNVLYRNSGIEDLAIIKDFVSGEDKIQLAGNRSDYSFFNQGSSNFIALVGNGNGQFNFGTDEVIASLNSSFNIVNDLIFV
jgi:Ca2+-binding RTX toxin-like protein